MFKTEIIFQRSRLYPFEFLGAYTSKTLTESDMPKKINDTSLFLHQYLFQNIVKPPYQLFSYSGCNLGALD